MLKNMGEAEYVADYMLGNGNKEDRSGCPVGYPEFLKFSEERQL